MKKKMNFTTRYMIIMCSVLLAVNLVTGLVLVNQSKRAMLTLINERMLDISNTAAASIDGDKLKSITAADKGSDDYNMIVENLRLFQENSDLMYIYTIQDMGNDTFGFIIDPDPISPGDFGEEVVTTDALIKAASGTAAVDEEPFTDSWGRFYSAYSPVFDSNGKVAGMVGADFDAKWLEDQVKKHNMAILLISIGAVIVGAIIVLLITRRVADRFRGLYDELSELTEDIENLNKDIADNPDYQGLVESLGDETDEEGKAPVRVQTDLSKDAMGALSDKLKSTHDQMHKYLAMIHKQAYVDPLTGVGNITTYNNAIEEINASIAAGEAEYAVYVTDINNHKNIVFEHGEEQGDKVVVGIAGILKKSFGTEKLYRIGDDTFAAITESMTFSKIEEISKVIYDDIEDYIRQLDDIKLSVSKGAAVYRPGMDSEYRHTFKRACEDMYQHRQGRM